MPEASKIKGNKQCEERYIPWEELAEVDEPEERDRIPYRSGMCVDLYNCDHLDPEDNPGKLSKLGGEDLGVWWNGKEDYLQLDL